MKDRKLSINSEEDYLQVYKELLNLNPEAAIIHTNGKIEFMNEASLRLIGAPSGYDYSTLHINQLLVKTSVAASIGRMRQIQQNNGLGFGVVSIDTLDNKQKTLEVHSQSIIYNSQPSILVIIKDITEMTQAQQNIKNSEALFRTIFDASPNIILITQIEDGKIIEANQAIENLTGFKKSELIGKTTQEVGFWLSSEDRNKVMSLIKRDGQIDNLELQFKIKDNSIISTLTTFRVIEIEGQKHLLSIIEDISNIRKLDNEKNQLLDLLNESQKIAKIGSWTMEIDTYKVHWSEEMYEILELQNNNGLADYEYFYSLVPEKEREMIHNLYLDSVKNKTKYLCIHRLVFKDGRVKWVEENGINIFDEDGKHIKFYGTTQDITQSKTAEDKIRESEEKFRLIAENTSDAIIVMDNNFDIIYLSPSYTKQFDIGNSFALPIGKAIYAAVIHPHDRDEVAKKIYASIQSGIKHFNYSYRAKSLAGDYMWREDNATVLYNDKNEFEKMYILSRDISERKIFEKELKVAKDRAEESDQLKTAFLQNMSHEIRTPLNGILGFSKLLENDDLKNEEIKEFVALIKLSSFRLLDTINNILELSQIETDQIILNIKPVLINSLILDLYEEYYEKAITKELEFEYKLALDDDSSFLRTDSKRLYQILSNLISNAIKFTHFGKINVGYTIDNYNIIFYVYDTGIGISPENMNKIFERFYQLEPSISRSYEGNGLGLPISKELAKIMGGEIIVESELGKGSKFFVSLPIS
ncbi:MAG TPA: PAS domain S-box protein [Candidatus Kapabacteria bacterium]|nr:PAS domain S-box protein [Candidatus Kapabacteria bacterium]